MDSTLGAGGLGTGYALSGYVDTRWAVELVPSAAASYQLDFWFFTFLDTNHR